jgi:hypothetical protein
VHCFFVGDRRRLFIVELCRFFNFINRVRFLLFLVAWVPLHEPDIPQLRSVIGQTFDASDDRFKSVGCRIDFSEKRQDREPRNNVIDLVDYVSG